MKKLVISMLLTGLVFCLSTALAEPAPKIGSEAPGLELLNLEGKSVSLQSLGKDKPVILVFFTSWSRSCQVELKVLQKLYSIKNRNFEVLAVSFDKKQKDLISFISGSGIAFPILLDKKLSSLDRFQVLIIPTTFCIDRRGVIRKIFVDYDDNVEKALTEWLKT
jgi:peroxiredoxin